MNQHDARKWWRNHVRTRREIGVDDVVRHDRGWIGVVVGLRHYGRYQYCVVQPVLTRDGRLQGRHVRPRMLRRESLTWLDHRPPPV